MGHLYDPKSLTLLSDVFGGLCNLTKRKHHNFMLNRKDFCRNKIPAARGWKKREKREVIKILQGTSSREWTDNSKAPLIYNSITKLYVDMYRGKI